jgi:phosphatidylinositol alpha-mannosyltransferase
VSAARAPLSVALLNPFFWPEVRRGSERLIHDLAVDLLELGCSPHLITSHPGRPRRTVEDGFTITRNWRPPEKPFTMRKIEPNLSHVPFSYHSLRRGDFALTHAFYPTDALAAVRWSEKGGGPSIFSYMGLPSRRVLTTFRRRMAILERVISDSDCVTTLSRPARDAMWRWFGLESRIIYPGVNLDDFVPGEGRADVPTISCAGAVDDARKRIPLLLRAFALVRRSRPDARLLLTRPPDPEAARRLTDGNPGLELVPRERHVGSVFRESWASGLTSYNEAFGLVLVESMACGTPVFGPNDGGPGEIIDRPEVGRVFEGEDESEVARAILETLELAEAPGTAQACRTRAQAFTSEASARSTLDLYEELVARG